MKILFLSLLLAACTSAATRNGPTDAATSKAPFHAHSPAPGKASLLFTADGKLALNGKECTEGAGNTASSSASCAPASTDGKPTFSAAFVSFLRQNAPNCVNQGLAAVKKGHASAIEFLGDLHSPLEKRSGETLHFAGRAFDLARVNVLVGEKRFAIDYQKASDTKTKERRFYDAYRDCWQRLLVARHCAAVAHALGSMGWESPDHQKSLHLSMPICPGDGDRMNAQLPKKGNLAVHR
jgi:hypothetical protein